MTLPVLITIEGYVGNSGGPLAGYLVFASPTLVRDSGSNGVKVPEEIVAKVGADGILSVPVPSTNDPAQSPTGWEWEVRPHFPGWTASFTCAIPYDSPDGKLDLSQLVQTPADGDAQLYALVNHTHEGGGGGDGPSPSSSVVSETGYGQSSGAGNATSYSRGNHTHGTPALPSPAAIGASATAHTHSGTYDPAGTAAAAVAALTKSLVLTSAAPVPEGTTAGTIIVRTA